eukprot:CAMPEP_0204581474 /NCGR_PEP_ID=MMETSP0661-20131031/44663_1 /ASSEMBLY_ACC=CAM_ASM_000606 /TAXON_ID=109239 /ORGANISM="Alexandrium margalefi, Strain AMGDE01CS-322" /LENGTH=177 /DNA_ID=CAMNT_0051590667 /DNA_START=54 /DNA_END=587 /DNA_ORIENTATION=+
MAHAASFGQHQRSARRSPARLLPGLLLASALAVLGGFAFALPGAPVGSSATRVAAGPGGTVRALDSAGSGRAASVARAVITVEESDLIQPDEEPSRSSYLVGFTFFAENFNGRVAMIGFFVLIFLEFLTNQTLFSLVAGVTGTDVVSPTSPTASVSPDLLSKLAESATGDAAFPSEL